MNFNIILEEQTPKTDDVVKSTIEGEETWVDEEILIEFTKFANEQKNCVALAANQVSLDGKRLNKNFFVKTTNEVKIYINPKIIGTTGNLSTNVEGCLTWPGKKIIAKRNSEILVEYYNHEGNKIQEILKDYDAQIFQHEYDHLNGVESLFEYNKKIDRNSPCPCGSNKKYKKCCG